MENLEPKRNASARKGVGCHTQSHMSQKKDKITGKTVAAIALESSHARAQGWQGYKNPV